MRILLAVAVLSICVTSAIGDEHNITRLTTNILEQASTLMEKAANAQDSVTVLAYLASNAVINVSFPQYPELQSMEFSKSTYAVHLADTWTKFRDVSIQRLKTEYKIADDGQSATAISTFRQSATLKATGHAITTSGKQVSVISLTDGVPQVARIDVTLLYEQVSKKMNADYCRQRAKV